MQDHLIRICQDLRLIVIFSFNAYTSKKEAKGKFILKKYLSARPLVTNQNG